MSTRESCHTDSRATILRQSAFKFCTALVKPPQPDEFISKYMTSNPRITEHGPQWATSQLPFLGVTFEGTEGCGEYFKLLLDTLKVQMDETTFPGLEGFIVDEHASATVDAEDSAGEKGVVSVVGRATFGSVRTGKAWKESFIYRLSGFDEDGRVGHWEIWADPLSAWKAVTDD